MPMAPPITPSKSSTSASAKPNNIGGIRRVLYDNNLVIDDEDAFERCSEIRSAALGIIQGDRNSGMQPGSHKELQAIRKTFATANELTFLVELWACLLHKMRDIQPLDPQGRIGWITQAWRKDHLRVNWGADFLCDSVPAIRKPDDKVLAKLLDSLPRVQNPRPDLVYGLRAEAFEETARRIHHTCNRYTVLSADLYDAFFLVEVKSAEGTIEDAENQCCRGGAAMIYARSKFNAQATTAKTPLGADLHSIAFSLALVPSKAHLFVHWAEVRENDVIYHMNLINSYDFRSPSGGSFAELRHDIDNVLDWGTLKRKREITAVCDEIAKQTNQADEEPDVELESPRVSKKRTRT
ncbi:hypothetical protein P7C71_g4540, partial [Lecanoromycetidae sp. Uapishka_2]